MYVYTQLYRVYTKFKTITIYILPKFLFSARILQFLMYSYSMKTITFYSRVSKGGSITMSSLKVQIYVNC